MDHDKSGKVSADEMKGAIKKMYGVDIKPALITMMMAAADTNSDGEIDLAEFKTIMRAYPEHKTPKK